MDDVAVRCRCTQLVEREVGGGGCASWSSGLRPHIVKCYPTIMQNVTCKSIAVNTSNLHQNE
jgi:hypothetical protein